MHHIAQGAENCLAGLTFIITGVLETVEREDAQELVTRHGGKLTQTVGKRTSYMVVGRDPGPAKMEKVRPCDPVARLYCHNFVTK